MSIPRITKLLEMWGKGRVIFQGSGSTAITYTKAEKNKKWKSLSGELWKTSSHASLPDNVVMIGL